jgi:hypothetical protein
MILINMKIQIIGVDDKKRLILIPENNEEIDLIDSCLGKPEAESRKSVFTCYSIFWYGTVLH